jgi:hypothetical protein
MAQTMTITLPSFVPAVTAPTTEEIQAAATEAVAKMRVTHAPVSIPVGAHPPFSEYSYAWYQGKEVESMYSTQVNVNDILRKHLDPRFKGRRVCVLPLTTHHWPVLPGQGVRSARP